MAVGSARDLCVTTHRRVLSCDLSHRHVRVAMLLSSAFKFIGVIGLLDVDARKAHDTKPSLLVFSHATHVATHVHCKTTDIWAGFYI